LQQTIAEQQETIRLLAGKVNGNRDGYDSGGNSTTWLPNGASAKVEDRLKKLRTRVSEIGAIKFSGDISCERIDLWTETV